MDKYTYLSIQNMFFNSIILFGTPVGINSIKINLFLQMVPGTTAQAKRQTSYETH